MIPHQTVWELQEIQDLDPLHARSFRDFPGPTCHRLDATYLALVEKVGYHPSWVWRSWLEVEHSEDVVNQLCTSLRKLNKSTPLLLGFRHDHIAFTNTKPYAFSAYYLNLSDIVYGDIESCDPVNINSLKEHTLAIRPPNWLLTGVW